MYATRGKIARSPETTVEACEDEHLQIVPSVPSMLGVQFAGTVTHATCLLVVPFIIRSNPSAAYAPGQIKGNVAKSDLTDTFVRPCQAAEKQELCSE